MASDAFGILARSAPPTVATDVTALPTGARLPADAGSREERAPLFSLARSASRSGATNQELDELASQLQIPNYVPCRMKDELRSRSVCKRECGIVNLQNSDQAGSHWVLYFKGETASLLSGDTIAYSSFGDPVPQELVEYLGAPIYTSDIQIQDFSEKSCGYYCIAILYLLSQKIPFEDIILGFKGI